MNKRRFPIPPLEDGRIPVAKPGKAMTKTKSRVRRGRKDMCPNCGTDLSVEEEGIILVACPECGFVFKQKYPAL